MSAIISIVIFVGIPALIVYMLETAPMGWEDEDGFHCGEPPKQGGSR